MHLSLFYGISTFSVTTRLAMLILFIYYLDERHTPGWVYNLIRYQVEGTTTLALTLQQLCTFLELEATFKNYVKMQDMDEEQQLISQANLKTKIKSLRVKFLVGFVLGSAYCILIPTLPYFREQETKFNEKLCIAFIFLTIAVDLYGFIKLSQIGWRLYSTFKDSYNGTLQRETKQILFYLGIFAFEGILAIFGSIFVLVRLNAIANIISELLEFLTGVFVIYFLAMIHVHNFQDSGE